MSVLLRTRFVTSAARLDQLPPPTVAEVCFAGRSNSGKSSAINVLAGQRRLAFSSKTPGRTRLINYFGIPGAPRAGADPSGGGRRGRGARTREDMQAEPTEWLGFLVDLPGYGYAAVDQDQRAAWADVLGSYLHERSSLAALVLVLDIRRGVTDLDRRLTHWVGLRNLPTLALLSKADKLPYGQRLKASAQARRDLAEIGTLTALPFSATTRLGLEEARAWIEQWFTPPPQETQGVSP